MSERNGGATVPRSDTDDVELRNLTTDNDKRTRFQVNRVRSESHNTDKDGKDSVGVLTEDENTDDDDLHSVTDRTRLNSEYVKSFRHLTREALPRLDNYRNIMSLQAANRPTLDELHNATLPNKGTSVTNLNDKTGDIDGQIKFGWIQGVLMRCLLNIWGVMLFLRLSWVVAQAGVGEAILLILTTTVVTSITALSMSAISTNGVIKGGGTYYMISRSLGPEFGGSIGLIFALANAVACAMYVVGFCESLNALLTTHQLFIIDGSVQDVRIIGTLTIVVLTLIVVIGMEWEAKAQIGLLVILLAAIFDFFVGSFIGPTKQESIDKGFVGFNLTVLRENFYPDYRKSQGVNHNFFTVFAVFFPAATGILAGANISGDLKDPQKSIPKGTLLAILITTLSYILMAFICGFTVLRDATGPLTTTSVTLNLTNETLTNVTTINVTIPPTGPFKYGLHNDFQVVELVAWFGPIIYAGCFAATLSSALASLVSAPKVFQALCKDKLYPGIEWFAKGYGKNNEPMRGYVLTFIIAVGFILIGELNVIAPLISNFFLAAYTLINFSTFHASLAKPVGWRPTFKYYNMWLSLAGSILCVLVMFLISWWTALVTFAAVLALYLIVSVRKPDVNWGSTTQAQIYKNALQAVQQLNAVEEHVKNYRPQILVLSGMPSARPALVDFAYLITKNQSLLVCGHINTSRLHQRVRNVLNYKANCWLRAHKLRAFYMQVDGQNFEDGCTSLLKACGIGKLRPNILLMGHKSDWQTCSKDDLEQYFCVLHKALDLHLSVGILRLQEGFDFSHHYADDPKIKNSTESLPRNQSYSHMSQASSNSDISVPNTPISRNREVVNVCPSAEDSAKKPKSVGGSLSEIVVDDYIDRERMSQMFLFQKKQKRGVIDVWWLYDDGGLTLLLPYIISTRRNWSTCKLRVFALANKRDELELEHRNMASLLAKFRIDYSDLQVVSDITNKPTDMTLQFFDQLIADFRKPEDENDPSSVQITDSELMAVKDKTNRHLRLRELLYEHSSESQMIVMTLPIPRKGIVSAPLYLAWLEALTRDMPPMLLVRGNQTSVLTFYS
ncbi:bumetanide-sensitive sodium-(potassium)-chloride cotransporter [Tribolium castaneum]|uniref:Bumetanide-sensitive sodium-(Potassium)-chloride cotransporter-like Protein n=1 Tax=Tribolium castaneum TaxID=7070 RepID=D2A527_TRICA|nr:PREDICTED: bumetanide-sensitive sodium-(potassium)-chloride cotransporter [Tribolium castaneum]EFA05305.2 Bumetanide-sensitive sodium-(potassium)-chloride cotransporter-like Protein [Tribolium castaneum]|eukprot:XP_969047.2 PREDICTED: bumetanide-sensitive sodium-(potassium)-chloride cotransporter [Tribolium castaneum]